MSDFNKVAEAIRLAYFEHELDRPLTQWKDLPDHRKSKWLAMAKAAVKELNK
jgi:hypothetical protein